MTMPPGPFLRPRGHFRSRLAWTSLAAGGGRGRSYFRRREGLGIDLVEDLELGELGFDDLLTVALGLVLCGLLDPVEVLVVAVQDFFIVFVLVAESHDPGGQFDRERALLVEKELEVL